MGEDIMVKTAKHSDEEKMAAAYALNMCNVSVSQIVDYNDLYILEQEYDAILNNLNLKKMPKDEALLRILTELLNTITFFRIQEVKRAQIQKKYEQKMKNAMWSAIPSLSVFVSGNPVVMALSIATTIGTGYMNYRKEKAQAVGEKEDAEIELQITAMEQFNALRRELFTTAWRLADEYDFEDDWRLTERQIKQYNEILMDTDEYRKYARLEAIQDKFMAYPAFWYFFGHTANYIAATSGSPETKRDFLLRARNHFEKYEQLNKYNILREDNLTASFALEFIDLMYLEGKPDSKKISELNALALKNAGNRFDIIQLCVMNYLRIGDYLSAVKWLKVLVNEDYNKIINAQILSGIYVGKKDRTNYEFLTRRVSAQYLYPMPVDDRISSGNLLESFEKRQKEVLKAKAREIFKRIESKSTTKLLKDISIFDLNGNYDEKYFDNTENAKRNRLNIARTFFANSENVRDYRNRIQSINLPLECVGLLNNIFGALFAMGSFQDKELQYSVLQMSYDAIEKNKSQLNQIQETIINNTFGLREYEILQSLGMRIFVENAFTRLFHVFANKVDIADSDAIVGFESELMGLCSAIGVDEPVISINGMAENDFGKVDAAFQAEMFGTQAVIARRNLSFIKEMIDFIKSKMKNTQIGEGLLVIYRGDKQFDRYFKDKVFAKYPQLHANTLMILRDLDNNHFDLLYTTEGIVYLWKNSVRTKTPYEEVELLGGALKLVGKKYRNENIDNTLLYEIALEFHTKFIHNLSEKTEYVSGCVDAKVLNAWFKEQNEIKLTGINMVYSWVKADLLKNMGYCLEEDLDPNHYLLQFFYAESGEILKLRIVEYDRLDSNFQRKLNAAGGVLQIER